MALLECESRYLVAVLYPHGLSRLMNDKAAQTVPPQETSDEPSKAEVNAIAPGVAAAPRRARKGRRRAATARIHALGIVEATLLLAEQEGIEMATSGDVLEWFKRIGYRSREGLPTRNSVYVSLHRAALNGDKRLSREEGGLFRFHFDASSA